jgi:3-phosphoshikimate 1-carboxyvinyltransferase
MRSMRDRTGFARSKRRNNRTDKVAINAYFIMKHYPHHLDLTPALRAEGTVRLPGSKSISNRTLLLAALAQGTTEIFDLLASDDTHVMLTALQKLGVQWEQVDEAGRYIVHGTNGTLTVHQADLFMGNAGTAIRPLTAALAVLGGDYTLHGVSRMHERPIGDLVDALNAVGAQIDYSGQPGYPPLHIRRGHIHAERIQVKGNVSSQFLTALLMVAPLMAKEHAVTIDVVGELISKPYIEITLNLMRRFGVAVERDGWQSFTVSAGQKYISPGSIHVEGDASNASYFLAAGAIAGGPVRVEGVGRDSIQGDVRFVEALEKMGATITMGDNWIEAKSNGVLKAIDADFNHIPDAAMTIAVAALYADGPSILRNIGSWRVKETDRLAAMAIELRKLGAIVDEGADYLRVTPPLNIKTAAIDTYDDHRMAMCFSLAALDGAARRGNTIRINDPQCVAKTFPDYFDAFAKIAHRDLL